MRGEFLGVQDQIFVEIFQPVEAQDDVDGSLFLDLFRDSIPQPVAPIDPVPLELNEDSEIFLPGDIEADATYKAAFTRFQERLEAYTDASSREDQAWTYFQGFFVDQDTAETEIVKALEDAFDVLQEYGGDELSNEYYLTTERFLEKYSLRYDLRRPFSLHPTLPGIFAKLIRDLKAVSLNDANMAERLQDFEEALRDLKIDQTSRRIRICIQAQMNLLEAVTCRHPQAEGQATLGDMCKSLDTWPHKAVSGSLSSLYGFSSDFSGVRHGKASKGVKREIDMRDLVSMSVILAGFVPYLTEEIDSEAIYAG
jgi:hypothetical protein